MEPSSTVRSLAALRVTVGATLFTCTEKVLVSLAPSLSVTVTETVWSLGPSAYVWLWAGIVPGALIAKTVGKLPSPQSIETDHSASEPGSLNEPTLKEWLAPPFAGWFAPGVPVGGGFATP